MNAQMRGPLNESAWGRTEVRVGSTGLLRWPRSELFGRRLSRPQDREVRGLLDIRLGSVVRVGVVRPDELDDLGLIDVGQLQEPAPGRERDLRVAEGRIGLPAGACNSDEFTSRGFTGGSNTPAARSPRIASTIAPMIAPPTRS